MGRVRNAFIDTRASWVCRQESDALRRMEIRFDRERKLQAKAFEKEALPRVVDWTSDEAAPPRVGRRQEGHSFDRLKLSLRRLNVGNSHV
jgi:hypothetical protein